MKKESSPSPKDPQTKSKGGSSKNVENTVFLRFTPYNPEIRRHTVQDIASEVGPIKKCSIIHKNDRSYGFIKFTCREDAVTAATQLHGRNLGPSTTLHAELASTTGSHTTHNNNNSTAGPTKPSTRPADEYTTTNKTSATISNKKTSRLMLRNLSFYATEKDIRKALKGTALTEVHIPLVGGKQPRGFAFVTCASAAAAKALTEQGQPVLIRKRQVEISFAMDKTAYEKNSGEKNKHKRMKKEESKSMEVDDESMHDSNADDDDQSVESVDYGSENEDEAKKISSNHDRTAVAEQRCLFMRNLPFDCTRHDVFELFRTFGYVTAIYIVKENKVPKGTAFVSFKTPESAAKALEQAAASEFVSQQETLTQTPSTGLFLKGRQIFVNLAVDKETAKTLTSEIKGRDRRNLYLRGEGRVENKDETSTEWDDLPEVDKTKRQTAWSDKITKLKSPLFFMNPNRLSIRNLKKTIDEAALKQLCALGVSRGLPRVTTQDQVAHWKAAGTLNARELLTMANDDDAVPAFDSANIKQHIPSVHIHRDFAGAAKGQKSGGVSRGFGFCEFEHHAHALACLRELNNNLEYAKEYAAGLQNSRLIVEFTVENTVKAKQQAEQKERQRSNQLKQQAEHQHQQQQAKKPKSFNQRKKQQEQAAPKSRGAAQREKKRKQREIDADTAPARQTTAAPATRQGEKPIQQEHPLPRGGKKPPKKKPKIDQGDATFARLVESYKKQAVLVMGGGGSVQQDGGKKKRWYE